MGKPFGLDHLRYAASVIKKALRTLAIAAPLTLALAAPAHAGSTYPPDVAALVITSCDLNNFMMSIDGAKPNSAVTGWIQFDSRTKITINETASASGGTGGTGTWDYSVKYPSRTKKTHIYITYTAMYGGEHTVNTDEYYYRADCPGLPVTGGNAAPVGKIALGAVLAGGLLATVAVRRRPRKAHASA